MAWWLLKTEPGTYSFADLERERTTAWTGVANSVAQKNLRAMGQGDLVAVYHTGGQKAVAGTARVARTAYPDPTAAGRDLCCVDLEAVAALPSPVALASLKEHPAFGDSPLVKQGRLSVVPLTGEQWGAIAALANRGR